MPITFNIDPDLKKFCFNQSFISFNTLFVDFKIKLNQANIPFRDQGNALCFDLFQQFDQQLKTLKQIPTKKLSLKHETKVVNDRLYLVRKINLNIKAQFNFNRHGLISSLIFELKDLDEDYSSWETYDIDQCHKLHLNWLQQCFGNSKKITSTIDLKYLDGYLIKDKSENIFWSLKIKQIDH